MARVKKLISTALSLADPVTYGCGGVGMLCKNQNRDEM